MNVVYIAGTPRSGTNYVQWLLSKNFKETMVITTYKHYKPRDVILDLNWNDSNKILIESSSQLKQRINDFINLTIKPKIKSDKFLFLSLDIEKINPDDLRRHLRVAMGNGTMKFIINIKNPYGWHLSFTKHWHHIKFGSSMNEWTDLYNGWVDFERKYPKSTIFIRHEDALRDHTIFLDKVSQKFGLEKNNESYLIPQKRLSTLVDEMNSKFKRKEYFMNEAYKDDLRINKKKELNDCRENLDKSLMKRFNYEVL